MQLPSWLVWLSAEFIVLLVAIIIWLLLAWQRSNEKQRLRALDMTEKILHQSSIIKKAEKTKLKNQELEQEIKTLQNQLAAEIQNKNQNQNENPFLQDKIDALIAENEDLQEEINRLRGQ